jgi:hypothetical protein
MNAKKLPLSLLSALVVMVLVYNPPTTAVDSNTTEAPSPAVEAADNSPRLVLEAGGHHALIRDLLFTAASRELVSV